jgi:hypothetical protein
MSELERKSYKLVELPDVTGLSLNFWRARHYKGELRTRYAEGAVVVLTEDLHAYLNSLPTREKKQQNSEGTELG